MKYTILFYQILKFVYYFITQYNLYCEYDFYITIFV